MDLNTHISFFFYWVYNSIQKILLDFSFQVFLGLPFNGTGDASRAYIKMYMKSTVKFKKIVYDYTVLSMLAEIGGYTGLLLGVSVVNLTSLIDRLGIKLLYI